MRKILRVEMVVCGCSFDGGVSIQARAQATFMNQFQDANNDSNNNDTKLILFILPSLFPLPIEPFGIPLHFIIYYVIDFLCALLKYVNAYLLCVFRSRLGIEAGRRGH